MKTPFLYLLKSILGVIVCAASVALINIGFNALLNWYFHLHIGWVLLFLLTFFSIFWHLFTNLTMRIAMFSGCFAPSPIFFAATMSLLSLTTLGYLSYQTWTIKDSYSGSEIFIAVLTNLLVLEIYFAMLKGSYHGAKIQELKSKLK